MPNPEKAREQRVRNAVERQGYVLRKDRARSWNVDHYGGFMIIDPYLNAVIAGERFDLDLDDVENWLKS
jgi:hypothetical protein